MKPFIIITLKILGILALACLLALIGGFFAVRLGLTNVAGEEDLNSIEYNRLYNQGSQSTASTTISISTSTTSTLPVSLYGAHEAVNWCKLKAAATINDYNAAIIFDRYRHTHSEQLLDRMILALKLRSADRASLDRQLSGCLLPNIATSSEADMAALLSHPTSANIFAWQNDPRWQTIEQAIIKDQDTINKVSVQTGVEPRVLVSVLIVEQLRLYYTQRELYEKFFAPLKILANANKMAWGIMSIKEKMAIQTEQQLTDPKSTFYPGLAYERLLDFPPTVDKAIERYNRLTNEHDHYYSYLYGALILKQFGSQWQRAGFNIAGRPEILATLFNIGFDHSQPKAEPTVGGSTIMIGNDKYFFGSLAYEFYYSNALSSQFPLK
ncbi:MAG: hypothetical protein WCO55_04635 [Candidatus Falkowbacteria bacterium]